MNKHELTRAMAQRTGDAHVRAELHLNALLEVLRDEMKKGGCVVLTGWGAFRVTDYAASAGRDPQTGGNHPHPGGASRRVYSGEGVPVRHTRRLDNLIHRL